MNDDTSAIRTFGRYQLFQELGRGAMGIVYRGFDPVIGRAVALKTIAFGETDPEAHTLRDRLYREACAAGTLSHPNIVTIYDVIEDGTSVAVAMEFIEGRTLADLIAERAPMPLDSALETFEQIAAALDYAGTRGVVHRDIKPANILLTSEGRIKIADFGVARLTASARTTQTGLIVGSPSYMSPEQIQGRAVDARSDIFSAVVVLYEMLTKERPFAGDDIATTMYRIVHEPPAPASQFNGAINPAINAIFERALAKSPDDRYRSGTDLYADLRRAATLGALPLAELRSVAPAPRRKLLLGLAAAVLVLVGGGALLVVLPRGAGQRQVASRQASTGAPSAVEWQALPEPEPAVEPAAAAAPPAVGSVTTVPPPVSGPVSTVPTPGRRAAAERPGPVPAPLSQQAAAPQPGAGETTPPSAPEPPPPQPSTATVQIQYDGASFPLSIYADGQRVGRIESGSDRLTIDAGKARLRAVSDAVFLEHDFGSLTLRPDERRVLSVPGTASAFVGVKDDAYDGLRILVDGRPVPGPYPAQIPRIAAAAHTIVFRWTAGGLAGVEITDRVDLTGGQHFLIRAVPEHEQVVVQKLR